MGDRATIDVTQVWQQIATGTVAVSVVQVGVGTLYFNQTASDTDQLPITNALINEQFTQNETVPTFVRASGDGWKVLADGVL